MDFSDLMNIASSNQVNAVNKVGLKAEKNSMAEKFLKFCNSKSDALL
jgi:hypothetical protein